MQQELAPMSKNDPTDRQEAKLTPLTTLAELGQVEGGRCWTYEECHRSGIFGIIQHCHTIKVCN
jgi:hypothetical protein